MPIRAGKLRHRVEIRRATEARDDFGGVVQSWTLVAKRWASVDPLRGRERFAAQQVQADVTHKVRLRYTESLMPTDRIVHDGRTFEIGAVLNVSERDREMELLCTESV